jgi:hypothetical protein
LEQLIEAIRHGVKSRSNLETLPDLETFIAGTSKKNFYDRLRYPDLDAVTSLSRIPFRAMTAETERSMAIAAIALKRHSLRHGTLPATLNALVPRAYALRFLKA